jgi:hypothetical protein
LSAVPISWKPLENFPTPIQGKASFTVPDDSTTGTLNLGELHLEAVPPSPFPAPQ